MIIIATAITSRGSMKVEFEHTREDYMDFSYEVTEGSMTIKNSLIKLGTFGGLLFLFGICFLLVNLILLNDQFILYMISIFSMGYGIYVLIRFVLFRKLFVRNVVERTVRDRRIYTYLGPNVVELSEKGVRRRNSFRDERVYWKGILKVVETDKHIFIHDTDVSAFIVPKRAFATKRERKEFIRFANEMIEASR